jgi:hypothetical protein
MINRRFRTPALLAAALLFSAACSDMTRNPVAPPEEADYLLRRTVSTVVGVTESLVETVVDVLQLTDATLLQRSTPVNQMILAGAEIGRDGGVITLPAVGLTVYFPAGAVRTPTTITVSAIQGSAVAYEFQPHGIQFQKPVWVVQDFSRTELADNLRLLRDLEGGYFPSADLIDGPNGTAQIQEFRPIHLFDGNRVGFTVEHFSGYAFTSGRAASTR